ncbi:hypothetical protein A9Z06_17080 [Rhizobium sp. YK2]|nr:hypothetical protein A9Z06_17080 [Rhizobium sp. YK2]
MAFERLVDEMMAKHPGEVLTLKQLSAELERQGLHLVVSVNVRVETRQEHDSNVRCGSSHSSMGEATCPSTSAVAFDG